MPPRRRGGTGYRGVRVRPSGTCSAEIRSGGGMRLCLGTFDTAQEGARAYDAAAWRLLRSRQNMNFADVATRERAQELAPFPRLLTDEDHRKHRRREHRLRLAEMDEQAMALWSHRFPEDTNEEQFFTQRRAKRREERADYCKDKRTRKAEMDEQAMALWSHRFPEDTNEEQFFTQRRAKRREERADYCEDKRTRKAVAKYNQALGDAFSWNSDDERFLDAYAPTSEEDITEVESESDE
ncbi:hypothetical protein CFC21_018650 [Triticum aestivum]|uniref:AP2/ERF domain-containing protein n=2 Tax=Triticum aestivum TaxID=4565 RepID=A0A9R1E406_WHEAT|nr:hypothetical protein CFC21_018650 [Triticum aestivum]